MADHLGYDAVFASAAVEFFVGQTKRNEVFQFISDDFIFDYWVDHAVKQVIVACIDYVE